MASQSIKRHTILTRPDTTALVRKAWDAVETHFEHFYLTAGVATLARMMAEDTTAFRSQRHERLDGRGA